MLELMACDGGCINGPGCSIKESLALKNMQVQPEKPFVNKLFAPDPLPDLFNDYDYIEALEKFSYLETDIRETLRSIGKQSRDDELNCGGCGYESCRDFARAVLDGKAERKMCVSYMRRLAQDKASALLQRMPYGVVIVDKHLHIVESNRNFAELAGESALLAYDAKPGLEGTDLRKLVSYFGYFENLFHTGENTLEKDIKTDAQFLHLSIFPLQANHLLCGIVHNLRAPELRREEIVKRTRKVIRENLETVQKISFYLGENASNMETLLNSIVNIQDEDYEDE
jgi:PAS domain-containing protein